MVSPPLDRSLFAVTDSYRYLDHAAGGPLSRPALEAGVEVLREHAADGALRFVDWERRVDAVRGSTAELLGVAAVDVAFVKNTTEGLSFVANGLGLGPGDRVLVADRDFPSTVYPWFALRDRDVEVDLLTPTGDAWALPIERFDEHLRRRPAEVVSVSWVQYTRGYRVDLEELARVCHRHGALLCVDAIQGVGVVPAAFLDWDVDFVATDAYKWMLGPYGCGALYVAARHRDRLRPLEPGWASVASRDRYDRLELRYDDSARRFEGGSLSTEAIAQMGASIDLLLDADVAAVWHHVDSLLDHLVSAAAGTPARVVSDRSAGGRSPIVTMVVDGHDPDLVVARLRAAGLVCSSRGGGIRVSPHGYNTADEVDALLAALVQELRG